MNIFNLSILFFSSNTFLIGLLVYLRRLDEVGRKWFIFSITATIWGFFYGLWANDLCDQDTALMWMRMSHVGAIFIPPTWLDFTYSFLELRNSKKKLIRFFYASSFILSSSVLTPYFLQSPRPFRYFFNYYPSGGSLYPIFTFLFVSCTVYVCIKTIQAYKLSSGERRSQIKYLLWGTGVGFIGGLLTFLPVYGIDFPQYNLLITPFYAPIMAYALTKHGLLDVEQIVQAIQRDRLAAIGLLSASVNHEIRSPLFVIKGYAETLLQQMEGGVYEGLSDSERRERVKRLLQKTIEQSERVVDITHRLTDFSKPAQEKEIADSVILNEVAGNVVSFVEHGLRVDNIKIEKEIAPQLILKVNQKHLEQILLNIVINASQAMEKQMGQIRISAQEKDRKVEISITDNGPGIPSDKLSRIFEPFFTTKESGTGLGLYITKQLVERNGGKIAVASQPGKGTSFVLEFRKSDK